MVIKDTTYAHVYGASVIALIILFYGIDFVFMIFIRKQIDFP